MTDITPTATLRQSNQERLQKLAQDGVGFDPAQMVMLRLDLLIGQTLSEDQYQQFELAWERQVEELIVAAEQAVTRAKLTAGLGRQQLSLADIKRDKPLGG